MRHLGRVHVAVFVVAWLAAFLLGPRGVFLVATGLLVVELLAWRLDLVHLPRSRRPGRARPASRAGTLPAYDDVRHAIATGVHSGREFDFGLRRRLQRIAASRLFEQHGIDMAADPRRAADVLGEEAWALLDPHRPVSRARGSEGVDRRRLARVVDRLESL